MTLGGWVLTLFVLGSLLICVGAFLVTWWVMVPGTVILLGSFVLTTWEREASESEWRWPR